MVTLTGYKHGMTGTPTWNSWRAMRKRCLSPTDKDFPRYGGAGITICEEWDEFVNFWADMGERPENTTLGRKDTDGNYSLNNCRWETLQQQNDNRSVSKTLTVDGETKSLAEWAKLRGLEYYTVYRRYSKGDRGEYCLRELKYVRKRN